MHVNGNILSLCFDDPSMSFGIKKKKKTRNIYMNNHVNNRIPEKSLLSNTTNFISFEYILFLWFHSRNKKSSFEPFEHPSNTILNIAM